MDRIILKNLAFYGFHGVMPEENTIGQKFFIDIELFVDLSKASQTDKVEDTVHYGLVYQVVKDVFEKNNFKLIEALAGKISSEIFSNFDEVKELVVAIRKPEAPVHGIFDYFGVEIRRRRDA